MLPVRLRHACSSLLCQVGAEDPFQESGLSNATCEKHGFGLPKQLMELVNAFPFGSQNLPQGIKDEFLLYLPTPERAMHLTAVYFENVATMSVILATCQGLHV